MKQLGARATSRAPNKETSNQVLQKFKYSIKQIEQLLGEGEIVLQNLHLVLKNGKNESVN